MNEQYNNLIITKNDDIDYKDKCSENQKFLNSFCTENFQLYSIIRKKPSNDIVTVVKTIKINKEIKEKKILSKSWNNLDKISYKEESENIKKEKNKRKLCRKLKISKLFSQTEIKDKFYNDLKQNDTNVSKFEFSFMNS